MGNARRDHSCHCTRPASNPVASPACAATRRQRERFVSRHGAFSDDMAPVTGECAAFSFAGEGRSRLRPAGSSQPSGGWGQRPKRRTAVKPQSEVNVQQTAWRLLNVKWRTAIRWSRPCARGKRAQAGGHCAAMRRRAARVTKDLGLGMRKGSRAATRPSISITRLTS